MAESDINRHKAQWEKYKSQDYFLEELSQHNKKIVKQFLKDFEIGINVPKSSKGKRTGGTLLKLRYICVFLNTYLKKDFEKITKKEMHKLFDEMGKGRITKENGKPFKDIGDYIKNTKTFWGWMLKTKLVKENILEELSQNSYKKGKPAWTYLTHAEMKNLIDNARGDYRALIMFLYDSGIRPAEAYRLYVSDLEFKENETLLTIPEKREDGSRVSKTFERTIKLKTSGSLIKSYIEINNLNPSDLLIQCTQPAFNKYLRELSKKIFGSKVTKARGRTDQLKLYDIRHMSSIFWLDKYRTHKDLMYRFGWSREDKVYYYSEFFGRRDKIDDEDMMTSEDKSKYEKQIESQDKRIKELEEAEIKKQMEWADLIKRAKKKFNIQ